MENKKDKKLIDLYKEWMESEKLPDNGLCNSLPESYLNSLDFLRYKTSEELNGHYKIVWAYGEVSGCRNSGDLLRKFTPLRQTIVLLICAIHNEL